MSLPANIQDMAKALALTYLRKRPFLMHLKDDFIQEALYAAVVAHSTWNPDKGSGLTGWVYKYVNGYLQNLNRKHRIYGKLVTEEPETEGLEFADNSKSAHEALEDSDTLNQFLTVELPARAKRAFKHSRPTYKEGLISRACEMAKLRLEGHTYEEIGLRLGLSSSSKELVRRSLKAVGLGIEEINQCLT